MLPPFACPDSSAYSSRSLLLPESRGRWTTIHLRSTRSMQLRSLSLSAFLPRLEAESPHQALSLLAKFPPKLPPAPWQDRGDRPG